MLFFFYLDTHVHCMHRNSETQWTKTTKPNVYFVVNLNIECHNKHFPDQEQTSQGINQDNKSGCWHHDLQANLSKCLPVCFTLVKNFIALTAGVFFRSIWRKTNNYCLFPTILFSSKIKRNDERDCYDVTFRHNRGNEEDLALLSQQ